MLRIRASFAIHDFGSDLLQHPKVVETQSHVHHSIAKHEHLIRTARISYRLARMLKADIGICVRAAIIHDIDSRLGTLTTHGRIAAVWASQQGESDAVCHAIETHMYPFGPKPRTREAWVVSLADKAASLTDLTVALGGIVSKRKRAQRRELLMLDPYRQTGVTQRRRRRRQHPRRRTL
jgi:glycyl-tRNA synthetase beta chain/uncharacterized protein